jgi:DNA-binding response OmpR family regulator
MPIIMVTAFSERSNVEAAISAGIDEFLVKPVSPQMLFKRIVWLIENPRPYLRFGSYFGPDRRRQESPNFGGEERRSAEEAQI